MRWSGKKVLVTGGGGFLGRHLIDALVELGVAELRSVGRTPRPELERLGVDCVVGDIACADIANAACEGRDVVFHTAAKAGVWGRREEFERSNVLGTKKILEGCLLHSVPILVNTSSPSVVFRDGDLENADESVPYPAVYPACYPETKALAEREVLSVAEKLGVVSLRPHLIWGVGDNHILPRIADRAVAGRLRRVGDGNNKVDLTHVSNAVFAHILAAEVLDADDSISGNVYFITDGAPVNLWDWINDFLGRMSLPLVSKSISYRSAYALGTCFELAYGFLGFNSEPPMTRFVAAELAHSHYFDISAARRDLGYAPSVDLDAAFDEAVEWLKSR